MTAISIPRTTGAARRPVGAGHFGGTASRLARWSADRRRRRYLVEQRRHDNRDRTDRYLDGPDETHQRQLLAAFAQR